MQVNTYQYLGKIDNLVIQTKVCFSEHEASVDMEHLVAGYFKVPMEDTVELITEHYVKGDIVLHSSSHMYHE